MAIGTGNNETQHLIIQTMLALNLSGKEVLDMGCGTGVLAILAAQKGAARIVGIDIDEWAYHNTLENCRLNDTEHVQTVLGGAEQIAAQGTFDYIFANINRQILVNDIQHYTAALKPDGTLFMSGFYEQDIPVVETVCKENGLSLRTYQSRNQWVAVTVTR